MKKALIISDGKPGHFNQSIALCSHLGLAYEILEISYKSKAHKALSYALDHLGIYTTHLLEDFRFQTSDFKLIISAGSTTYYANKLAARNYGIPNIAILKPSGYRLNFSHIFCPSYDHPPKRKNITELPLNLCAANQKYFKEKANDFLQRHQQTKPAVGIIIGGDNAVSEMVPDDIKKHLETIFALTEGMERWITTSRRTPKAVEKIIEELPFDYSLINSRDSYNPIPAFIHLCDRIFVTSDSASMMSECASFGEAKVEILMNKQLKSPNKFEDLIQGLININAAHAFSTELGSANSKVAITDRIQKSLTGLI